MNQTLKTVLIKLGILVLVLILVGGGFFWGRTSLFTSNIFQGGMMGGSFNNGGMMSSDMHSQFESQGFDHGGMMTGNFMIQ